jgi:hypothetical protein
MESENFARIHGTSFLGLISIQTRSHHAKHRRRSSHRNKMRHFFQVRVSPKGTSMSPKSDTHIKLRNRQLLRYFKKGFDLSTWDRSSTNLRQSYLSKTVNISILVAIFLKESRSKEGIDRVANKSSTESS